MLVFWFSQKLFNEMFEKVHGDLYQSLHVGPLLSYFV